MANRKLSGGKAARSEAALTRAWTLMADSERGIFLPPASLEDTESTEVTEGGTFSGARTPFSMGVGKNPVFSWVSWTK